MLLLLPLLATVAHAQTLEPIYIEAELPNAVGEVEHSEFTGSHTRISGEKISKQGAGLAALLAHESGIQFKQSGGVGSYTSITVRAASAAQTNVYLDGVLLNNASSGAVDLSQLELLNLSSIDIYRGATPIQLGISNIGGAVNLLSFGRRQPNTQLRLGFGSFSEKNFHINNTSTVAGWNMQAAASYVDAQNDFSFVNENGTPLNSSDDKREKRYNSEFSRSALLFKLSNDITEARSIDAMVQYTDRLQALPHWSNRRDVETELENKNIQLQANHRMFSMKDTGWNHNEGVYIHNSVETYDDRYSKIGLGAQATDVVGNIVGVKSYWEKLANVGTFAFNIDAKQERLKQNDNLGGNNSFTAKRTGINSAAQFSYFAFNEKLLVTPALRWQASKDSYNGVLRSGEPNSHHSDITAQLGASWQQSRQLQFSANVGQHKREPVFFELFGDRGLYIGNASLKSEEGINADLGVQWQSGQLPGTALNVTGFASWRDELIVSVYDSLGIGRSVNSGSAEVFGLEFDSQYALRNNWQFKFNVTWQSAKNISNTLAYNGNQLAGEAQLVGYTQIRYKTGMWQVWYESDFMRERYYDTANLLPAENFLTHNIGVSFTRRKLKTVLLLKNLSNVQTEDYNGYPKPGRSFHINFTYDFRRERA